LQRRAGGASGGLPLRWRAPPEQRQVRVGRRGPPGRAAMSVVAVLRLPLDVDLSGFLALLRRLRVPCRVSEESGSQVLWVPEPLAAQVRELYERYPQGDPAAPIEGERVDEIGRASCREKGSISEGGGGTRYRRTA